MSAQPTGRGGPRPPRGLVLAAAAVVLPCLVATVPGLFFLVRGLTGADGDYSSLNFLLGVPMTLLAGGLLVTAGVGLRLALQDAAGAGLVVGIAAGFAFFVAPALTSTMIGGGASSAVTLLLSVVSAVAGVVAVRSWWRRREGRDGATAPGPEYRA